MIIKLSYSIEIDESKYPHLTKTQIREIVRSMEVGNGCADYILRKC